MDISEFTDRMPGSWVKTASGGTAFLPDRMPRQVGWLMPLVGKLDEASRLVARVQGLLEGDGSISAKLLMSPLIQREALLSSRIEGTYADTQDLAVAEISVDEGQKNSPDVLEVRNNLDALAWGIEAVRERPITVSLIKRLHEMLLTGVRGNDQRPGELRDIQVYIGSTGPISQAKFIPPPPLHVPALLDDMVDFITNSTDVPLLVRVAMVHYQFETIHPFRDGNGRVGRLLIALMLVREMQMPTPSVHLSGYFERERRGYYDGLLRLSQTGDWAAWVGYFLDGVIQESQDARRRLEKLRALRLHYQAKAGERRASVASLKLIDILFESPALDVKRLAEKLDLTFRAAQKQIDLAVSDGFVQEVTARARSRIYVASEILKVAAED